MIHGHGQSGGDRLWEQGVGWAEDKIKKEKQHEVKRKERKKEGREGGRKEERKKRRNKHHQNSL